MIQEGGSQDGTSRHTPQRVRGPASISLAYSGAVDRGPVSPRLRQGRVDPADQTATAPDQTPWQDSRSPGSPPSIAVKPVSQPFSPSGSRPTQASPGPSSPSQQHGRQSGAFTPDLVTQQPRPMAASPRSGTAGRASSTPQPATSSATAAASQSAARSSRDDIPVPFHVPRTKRDAYSFGPPSDSTPDSKPAKSPQPSRTSPSPPPPTHPRPARPNRSYTGLHSPLSKLRSSSVPAVHPTAQPPRTASPPPKTRLQPSPSQSASRPQLSPTIPVTRTASTPPPASSSSRRTLDQRTARTISFEVSPGGGIGTSWAPSSSSLNRSAAGAAGFLQPSPTKFAPGVWSSLVPPPPSLKNTQPVRRRSVSPSPHNAPTVSKQSHSTFSVATSQMLLDMDPLTFEGLNPEQLTLLHDIMAAGPVESWPATLAENPEAGGLTFAPHAQPQGSAASSVYGSRSILSTSVEGGFGRVDRAQQQRSGDDRRALASPRWRKRNPLEGYNTGGGGGRETSRMVLDLALIDAESMQSSAGRPDRTSHQGTGSFTDLEVSRDFLTAGAPATVYSLQLTPGTSFGSHAESPFHSNTLASNSRAPHHRAAPNNSTLTRIGGGSNTTTSSRSLPVRAAALSRSHVGSTSHNSSHHGPHHGPHTHTLPLPSGLRKTNTYAVLRGSKPAVVSLTLAHASTGENDESAVSSAEEVGATEGDTHEDDPFSDVSRSALVSAAGTIPESVQGDVELDPTADSAAEPFLPAPPSPADDNFAIKQQKKKQRKKRGPLSFFSCLFCIPTTESVDINDDVVVSQTLAQSVAPKSLPSTEPATSEGVKSDDPHRSKAGDPAQPAANLPLRHDPSSHLSSKTSHSTLSGQDSSNDAPNTTPFAHFLNVSLSGPLRIFGEEEEDGSTPARLTTRAPTPPRVHPPTAAATVGQHPRGMLAAAVVAQHAARGGRGSRTTGRRPSVPPHEDNDIVMMRSVDTAVSVHDHPPNVGEGPVHDRNTRSTASSATLFFPIPAAPLHPALLAAPLEVSDRDRAAHASAGGVPGPFHQGDLSFGEMLVQLQAIIEQDIAAHTLPGNSISDALKLTAMPGLLKDAVSLTSSLVSQPGSPRPSRTFLVVADDDSIATHRRLQISRSGRALREPPSDDGTPVPVPVVRATQRHVSALDGRRGGKKVWFRRQNAASAALAASSPATAHDGGLHHSNSSTPHSGIHNGGIFRASRTHHSAKARRAHHDPASRRASRTSEHEDLAAEECIAAALGAQIHARSRGRKRRAATELLLSASIASLWKAPWQAPGTTPLTEFVTEDPSPTIAGTATAAAHKAASFSRKTTTSSEAPLSTAASSSHSLQPQRSLVPPLQEPPPVLASYTSVPVGSGYGAANMKGKASPMLRTASIDRTARGVMRSAVAAVALSSLHATWGPKRAAPQPQAHVVHRSPTRTAATQQQLYPARSIPSSGLPSLSAAASASKVKSRGNLMPAAGRAPPVADTQQQQKQQPVPAFTSAVSLLMLLQHATASQQQPATPTAATAVQSKRPRPLMSGSSSMLALNIPYTAQMANSSNSMKKANMRASVTSPIAPHTPSSSHSYTALPPSEDRDSFQESRTTSQLHNQLFNTALPRLNLFPQQQQSSPSFVSPTGPPDLGSNSRSTSRSPAMEGLSGGVSSSNFEITSAMVSMPLESRLQSLTSISNANSSGDRKFGSPRDGSCISPTAGKGSNSNGATAATYLQLAASRRSVASTTTAAAVHTSIFCIPVQTTAPVVPTQPRSAVVTVSLAPAAAAATVGMAAGAPVMSLPAGATSAVAVPVVAAAGGVAGVAAAPMASTAAAVVSQVPPYQLPTFEPPPLSATEPITAGGAAITNTAAAACVLQEGTRITAAPVVPLSRPASISQHAFLQGTASPPLPGSQVSPRCLHYTMSPNKAAALQRSSSVELPASAAKVDLEMPPSSQQQHRGVSGGGRFDVHHAAAEEGDVMAYDSHLSTSLDDSAANIPAPLLELRVSNGSLASLNAATEAAAAYLAAPQASAAFTSASLNARLLGIPMEGGARIRVVRGLDFLGGEVSPITGGGVEGSASMNSMNSTSSSPHTRLRMGLLPNTGEALDEVRNLPLSGNVTPRSNTAPKAPLPHTPRTPSGGDWRVITLAEYEASVVEFEEYMTAEHLALKEARLANELLVATPPRKRAEHPKEPSNVSALEQSPEIKPLSLGTSSGEQPPEAQLASQTLAGVSLPAATAAANGARVAAGSSTLPADAILEALRTSSGNLTGRLPVSSSSLSPIVKTTSLSAKQGWSVTGGFSAPGPGSPRKLGEAFGTPIPFQGAQGKEGGQSAGAFKQQQRKQAQKAASADTRWESKAAAHESSDLEGHHDDVDFGQASATAVPFTTTHHLPNSRISNPGQEEGGMLGHVPLLQMSAVADGGASNASSNATVIVHSNTQHSSCSGSSRDFGASADSVEVLLSEQVPGIELRGSQEDGGVEGSVVGGRCQVLVLKPRN